MSLSKSEKDRCREVAAKVLQIEKKDLPLEIPFKELRSIYYSIPGEKGKSVLVCCDGEHLLSHSFIPMKTHIEAFKNGLRSS